MTLEAQETDRTSAGGPGVATISKPKRPSWWVWLPWPPFAALVAIMAVLTYYRAGPEGSILIGALLLAAGGALSLVQLFKLVASREPLVRPGLCAHCDYPVRTSDPAGARRCPECGLEDADAPGVRPPWAGAAVIAIVCHLLVALGQFAVAIFVLVLLSMVRGA